MAALEPIDLNKGEDTNPQSPDWDPLTPDPSPVVSSGEEEEEVYIHWEDGEAWQYNIDPRLDIIDKQFNQKMKELFSRSSSGQPVSNTVEATLQHTAEDMLKNLAKSHPLTWLSQVRTSPEQDELLLWMTVMKENIDVLISQFKLRMLTGYSKIMSEMVKLYHK